MAFVGRPTIGADISGEAVDFVLSLFAAVAASTEGLQIAGNELREVALVGLHVVADLRSDDQTFRFTLHKIGLSRLLAPARLTQAASLYLLR